jgi:dsDNA-specific endonuclease/ATPase MutS2
MKTITTNKKSELKVGDILVYLSTGETTEVTEITNRWIYTSCGMKLLEDTLTRCEIRRAA